MRSIARLGNLTARPTGTFSGPTRARARPGVAIRPSSPRPRCATALAATPPGFHRVPDAAARSPARHQHAVALAVAHMESAPPSSLAGRFADLSPFLAKVEECNAMGAVPKSEFYAFIVAGKTVGYLLPSFAELLGEHAADVFAVFTYTYTNEVRLVGDVDGAWTMPGQRTAAVGGALARLRAAGAIAGWRDELFPVAAKFGEPPLLLMERAAVPHFGVKAYGVHVNGYVRHGPGLDGLRLWVATRAKTKSTWPGMWDHLAAGGQPHGISLADNVIKECGEEAGVPAALAAGAAPVGAVSYEMALPGQGGLKRDVLFCYDLELPESFVPTAVDGEVASFELRGLGDVAAAVASSPGVYKPNCQLVVLDFLVRWGAVPPDAPRYLELVRTLRSGDLS